MRVRRLAFSIFALVAVVQPAAATGAIFCHSNTGATLHLQIGSGAVGVIIGAQLSAGDKNWSTFAPDATPIVIEQSFLTATQIRVDIGDEFSENLVAKVRLFIADEGNDYVTAGTLQLVGDSAHAVSCDGP